MTFENGQDMGGGAAAARGGWRGWSWQAAVRLVVLVCVAGVWGLVWGAPAADAVTCPTLGANGIALLERTQTSARLHATVETRGVETQWRFEYVAKAAREEAEAKKEAVPWEEGDSGTIPTGEGQVVSVTLTGLVAETEYWVRLVLVNSEGCEVVPELLFETVPLRPRVAPVKVLGASRTAMRLKGAVIPDNFETEWWFEYVPGAAKEEAEAKKEGVPWKRVPGGGTIPAGEADEEFHQVEDELTGLSQETVYFLRMGAENEHGEASHEGAPVARAETGGRPVVVTFRVHTFDGGVVRVLGSVIPRGSDTHYHFEYVPQAAFEASGWSGAASAAAVDAGSGEYTETIGSFPTRLVGEDLPGLVGGVAYRFRIVAENEAGSVAGGEESLTAPVAGASSEPACPNAVFRTGLSARLPDCRAYEQVTPTEKAGTMDTDTYGLVVNTRLVGEDGEEAMLNATGTQWGESPDATTSSYLFSRTEGGWVTRSVTPQPEAGVFSYALGVAGANLESLGVEVGWAASRSSESPDREFKVGPPGGPYVTAASIPSGVQSGWAAASPDLSKLVLESEDRTLAGHATGTKSGGDLYEYAEGAWRQLNVASNGKTIGTCGAQVAHGFEGHQPAGAEGRTVQGSPHTVSADGSRVFFEASPGGECEAARHLYMRVGGSETIDIGAYAFLGANAQGTLVLLEKKSGAAREFDSYDSETGVVTPLFKAAGLADPAVSGDARVLYFTAKEALAGTGAPALAEGSEDLGAIPEDIYRYDVASHTLSYIAQGGEGETAAGGGRSVSPDGRFFYFPSTGLGGVPGGAKLPEGGDSGQLYRFDSSDGVVECVSCASGFNPHPGLSGTFLFGHAPQGGGVPDELVASADGRFVFFDTTAALVPGDVDGEIPPTETADSEYVEFVRSPSSDTYEWRGDGVDGCGLVQGCVALISGGLGGYKTELVGATASGRDVFFATHEALVAGDVDSAGDIYDARIGGGFPGPVAVGVECEGDACSSPVPAPVDVTPASMLFSGAGNLAPAPLVKPKPKRCRKGLVRNKHGKCVKKKKKRRCRKGLVRNRHGKCVRRRGKGARRRGGRAHRAAYHARGARAHGRGGGGAG